MATPEGFTVVEQPKVGVPEGFTIVEPVQPTAPIQPAAAAQPLPSEQPVLPPAPAEQLANIPKSDLLARNLSEIGAAPELNELNLDSIKAALAANLITNEVELADAIKSNIPESEISQDKEGNTLIKFPSGTYAINKPGFSAQDFFQLLVRGMAFIPAGRGITRGLTGLVRGGLQAGATEAGLQIGEQLLGGEVSPGQIGLAAVAAPAGQVIGERVMAPAARAVIGKFKDIKAGKLLEQAAPSIATLKQATRDIHKQIDESGARVSSKSLNRLIIDINSTIKKEGFRKSLHPKTSAVLDEFIAERGKSLTATQIDELRKVAKSASLDLDPSDSRLGNIIIDKIDNFLDKVDAKDLVGNKNVGSLFKESRRFWGRAKRAELVQEAFTLAKDQASGFENGLRAQFRSLLRRIDKGRVKGFSAEEIKAMRIITQGTTAANITKQLGKFGISQDQATNSLMVGLGGTAGFAFGGGPGAIAVPAIGTVSRALSEKLTKGAAKFADQIIRAGPNANKIVRAYMGNVPKNQRNVEELTELLIRPNVDLSIAKETGNKLIDDAIFFARNISTALATTNEVPQ